MKITITHANIYHSTNMTSCSYYNHNP